MSDDTSHDTGHPKTYRFGYTVAVLLVSVLVILAIGRALYFVSVAFTGFEFHRDKMFLRCELIVKNENLRYSPSMDDVMWCRFTVEAKSIDDVFDPARVDASEFDDVAYEF